MGWRFIFGFAFYFSMAADGLPDSSGKPGEGLPGGPVPDLERIAGTKAE